MNETYNIQMFEYKNEEHLSKLGKNIEKSIKGVML